jgi:RNA polymerase sigma factor (sigma-70 family)
VPFGAAFPQVLAAAQADAPWAYQRLFDWLGRPVAGYLRGQGADDADGLANDVFLRAFTSLATFTGGEDRFRSWIFAIAHNLLVDERRRRHRRPVIAGEPVVEAAAPGSTESEALTRLGADRVRSLLVELSPDQRDVLLLRIVADLTVEQVAEALGKAPGAVKQLQRRGLATLRRRLEGAPDRGRTPSGSVDVHYG